MTRAWWAALFIAIALGSRVASGQGATAPAPPLKVVIGIDGGNAFVFGEGNKRVDVGPVKMPRDATPGDFNSHPMFVKLDSGDTDPTVASPQPSIGPGKWELAGHEVWACPDGVCGATFSLSTSPDRGADPNPCYPPTTNDPDLGDVVDNMYYLPDLLDLHGTPGVANDWPDRLEGRLVLSAGRLVVAVTNPCYGMRWYWKHRAMPDGEAGMKYVVRAASYLELQFKQLTTGTIRRVRLKPKAGSQEIKLRLTMDVPSIHVPADQEIAHFQQFYELVPQIWKIRRIKLSYKPASSEKRLVLSPGSECPGARFGGP